MKLMTMGNVSKQSGIGVETVRFYEKSGLIGACAFGGPDGECPILEALEPDWHL